MWLAAPVYSVGLVLFTAVWFARTPVLSTYAIGPVDVLAAALIAVAGGLVMGGVGNWLADRAPSAPD
jgi:hypothetical protein